MSHQTDASKSYLRPLGSFRPPGLGGAPFTDPFPRVEIAARIESMSGANLDRRIELIRGDITEQDTDAVVNAANTTLLGGGGVDGAIHRAGGPAILAECKKLGGCATGDAKATGAGNLRARYVIHTVGPVYRDGEHGEAELLASAYRRSLEVASTLKTRRVAFPSISTGAYRFPIAAAARIALSTVRDYLRLHDEIDLVRFVLFSEADLAAYEDAARVVLGGEA